MDQTIEIRFDDQQVEVLDPQGKLLAFGTHGGRLPPDASTGQLPCPRLESRHMAHLGAIVGVPHAPYFLKQSSGARGPVSASTLAVLERGQQFADILDRSRPDVLLVVGNDHFHQFFMGNMPAFLIGRMSAFAGVYPNEVREFGMTPCTIPGEVAVANELLEGGLARGVDFAFSDDLRLDHSVVTPLVHLGLRPGLDLPIVPILTNCVAPPLPPARRFLEVGTTIRTIIDDMDPGLRVAVVCSGHLSLDIGGPRQFLDEPTDREFDERVVEYVAGGDIGRLLGLCSAERMMTAGNVTLAVMNFVLGMGIAGDMPNTHAEALGGHGPSQPFFAWQPDAPGTDRSDAR